MQAQYEYAIALRKATGPCRTKRKRGSDQLPAQGSNGPAQLALGIIYRTGLGIPIDNLKAYVWLSIAAAQSVPGAAAARDTVLPRLSPTELQEAQAEARRLSALYLPKPTPAQ